MRVNLLGHASRKVIEEEGAFDTSITLLSVPCFSVIICDMIPFPSPTYDILPASVTVP